MLFSERYAALIETGKGEAKDHICGNISFFVKQRMAEVMHSFAEPQIIHPNRYDNYEKRTTALDQAVERMNDQLGFEYVSLDDYPFFSYVECDDPIATSFTPYMFNIIELQYEELSDGEKAAFQNAMNKVLYENDIPWILHDGKMVKIDSLQFEMDLRNKTLQRLSELKDSDPKFASGYSELIKAFEFFERMEYGEAINNAGKSYESVLKVACSELRGNADKLTNQWISIYKDVIPTTMTPEGFREKVLMSLPYLRNNSAAAHGAGDTTVELSKEMAKLALNLAAALETYLVEEYAIFLSREID